jgi:hypothetical protein
LIALLTTSKVRFVSSFIINQFLVYIRSEVRECWCKGNRKIGIKSARFIDHQRVRKSFPEFAPNQSNPFWITWDFRVVSCDFKFVISCLSFVCLLPFSFCWFRLILQK